MKKILAVLVGVLILCFLPLSHAKADTRSDVENRLDQIEKELAALKKEVSSQKEAWEKNIGFLKSIRLGGEIRTRWEILDAFDLDRNNTDDFFLIRTRFSIEATPVENLRIFIQAQDARVGGDERDVRGGMRGDLQYVRFQSFHDDNNLDLKQGYFDIANLGGLPVTLRIGRQVLSYGDERLVGANDWDNFGRSFDAVKLIIEPAEGVQVDAWYAKVVEELKDDRLDEDDDVDFYGLYMTTSNFEDVGLKTMDLYGLVLRDSGLDNTMKPGTLMLPAGLVRDLDAKDSATIWTVGTRLVGVLPMLETLDYNVETAVQMGSIGADTHHAWAIHGEVGMSFPDIMMAPRIGAFFAHASGDSSPSSGSSNTFLNLFPENHDKYGRIDFMNWQNMYDVGGNITIKPIEGLTAIIEYHNLRLAEENDAWYGSPRPDLYFMSGKRVNIDGENGVGDEVDLTLQYDYNEYVSFEGGYSLFIHGDLIRRGLDKGGFRTSTNESNWGYLQAKVHF
ncbi:MAG: DUF3373 family protein [Candidatus Schekmanbacteria bacterium]|nr:MAG: DUF3373 family protein [Candidatus Schekmanbacteria bacterium]